MAAGYRGLRVWQEAMSLVGAVYRLTGTFPPEERYGITAQMRRAAISVPSNIAEGYGRSGNDYDRLVGVAYGSLLELETQLELSAELEYSDRIRVDSLLEQTGRLGRMINALRTTLRRKSDRTGVRQPAIRT